MSTYEHLRVRPSLDKVRLGSTIRSFFSKHRLHPRGTYLIGGFARGRGRKETPDIDVLVDIGEVGNEKLFHYLDVFAEAPKFAGYSLEFHIPSESYNPVESYPERIRLF